MRRLGTTDPETDPALQRRFAETRERQAKDLRDRERASELIAAFTFLVVAGAIAVLLDTEKSLDVPLALALVACYALAGRVEFHTGAGWTVPTQLVFVPMLFLLPIGAVPLFVALALVLTKVPEFWTREVAFHRAVTRVGDAWYAVGPSLVLGIAGATNPAWSDWPIYVGALGAQFACDFTASTVRLRFGLGMTPATLVPELAGVYLVDALMAPAGLLVAFATWAEPWAFLLVMPLIGLLAIFAREREARIENALTLSHAYRGTALLLGELLSTSDEYTGTHSKSVVVLAHQVGAALGLDERELQEIEFGALLHDVGKLSVPNSIIQKPGALTAAEMELMRTHTVEGEGMLSRIGGVLGDVGQVVRSHHEYWDGGGYPDGLRGEEIPMAARVIACCDAFNAMTTDRPYRRAMPLEAALDELRTFSGSQFDPDVVEAVIEIVETWNVPRFREPVPAGNGAALASATDRAESDSDYSPASHLQ